MPSAHAGARADVVTVERRSSALRRSDALSISSGTPVSAPPRHRQTPNAGLHLLPVLYPGVAYWLDDSALRRVAGPVPNKVRQSGGGPRPLTDRRSPPIRAWRTTGSPAPEPARGTRTIGGGSRRGEVVPRCIVHRVAWFIGRSRGTKDGATWSGGTPMRFRLQAR